MVSPILLSPNSKNRRSILVAEQRWSTPVPRQLFQEEDSFADSFETPNFFSPPVTAKGSLEVMLSNPFALPKPQLMNPVKSMRVAQRGMGLGDHREHRVKSMPVQIRPRN